MKLRIVLMLLFSVLQLHAYQVGLLIVATGRYIEFVPPLIESAQTHFCRGHKVTYFVFTDGQLPAADNIVVIPQKRLGWPYDTMMRCGMYEQSKHLFQHMDYLFACDADMRFVNTVGDEILSERVATLHPGYVGTRGTYETNPLSTACIPAHEGGSYFAGGFHGGSRDEFIKLVQTMHNNIQIDLKKGLIAIWHDESHLNRYFASNAPTCVLSPSYCYPESREMIGRCGLSTYTPRLIALDKNHSEYRK